MQWREKKAIWAKAKAVSEGRPAQNITKRERSRVEALAEEMKNPETTSKRQQRIIQGFTPEESRESTGLHGGDGF